jgi:hypothetical protein
VQAMPSGNAPFITEPKDGVLLVVGTGGSGWAGRLGRSSTLLHDEEVGRGRAVGGSRHRYGSRGSIRLKPAGGRFEVRLPAVMGGE